MHGRCSRRTSTPSDSSWSASARPVPSSSSSSSGMVGVSGWVGSTLSSGGCQWAMHGCGDVLLPSLDVLRGAGVSVILCCWARCSPCGLSLLPLRLRCDLRIGEGQRVRSRGRHRGGRGGGSYYYVCNYKWQQQLHGLHKISNPCAAELMRRLFQLHNALLLFHLAAKMNKHPGKQYPHAAQGPAPPLPPGQPPAQQQHQNPYGQTPEQAAAHAAAWAAYYQASRPPFFLGLH